MVFFFYVGNGPWAILLSIGVSLLSTLLTGQLDWQYSADPTLSWDEGLPIDVLHPRGTVRPGAGARWRPQEEGVGVGGSRQHQFAGASAAGAAGASSDLARRQLLAFALGATFSLSLIAYAGFLLARPEWARGWLSRRILMAAQLAREGAELAGLQFHWQWGGAAGGAGAGGHAGRGKRDRAPQAEVSALPMEEFVSERELLQWSPTRLKDELRRLQILSDMRMGRFSGGSSVRATHCLLRAGCAVEKPELVAAVLKARGGDSGVSCAVCLAAYESGEKLRVLPCGHRFHCGCVDRWLVEQSRTCPLCSKRV